MGDEKMMQRREVARELLLSEETYVQQLSDVVDHCYSPLLELKLVPSDKLKRVFSGLRDIKNLSAKFLDELKHTLPIGVDFSSVMLGPTLMTIFPYFKFYELYLRNHPLAIETLQEISPYIQGFLSKKENKLQVDLHSSLIAPLQRIPRYMMLVERLLECTPQDHPDKEFLQEALDHFKVSNEGFRKAMEEGESYLELVKLQKMFDTSKNIAKFGRRLIMSGILYEVKREHQYQKYSVHLFNDIMIWATGDTKLSIAFEMRVSKKFRISSIEFVGKHQFMMEIVSIDKSLDACAPDEKTKKDWMIRGNNISKVGDAGNDRQWDSDG